MCTCVHEADFLWKGGAEMPRKKQQDEEQKKPKRKYAVSTKQTITDITPENIQAVIKRSPNDMYRVNEEPGEVAKLVAFHMEFADVERADFKETSDVRQHIDFYLQKCAEYDMRPTVVGLANCLCIDRVELYRLYSGNYRNGKPPYGASEETIQLLKKTYSFIAENLEVGMQNGKVNPVSAMFLLKNHLGYTDTNEVVIKRSEDSENVIDVSEIRKRYEK